MKRFELEKSDYINLLSTTNLLNYPETRISNIPLDLLGEVNNPPYSSYGEFYWSWNYITLLNLDNSTLWSIYKEAVIHNYVKN
jgi:hypothetical protein